MAVKIRLTRMGRKKKPFYRIVVMDTRAKRDGKYIEKLGIYNPMVNPPEVTIDEERVLYWLGTGAMISDTAKSLLKHNGILHKRSLKKRGLSDGEVEEEMKKWEVLQIEKRRALEKKAEKKQKEIIVEEVEETEKADQVQEEAPEQPAEDTAEKAEKPAEKATEEQTDAADKDVKASEEAPEEKKEVKPEQDPVDQQQEKENQ